MRANLFKSVMQIPMESAEEIMSMAGTVSSLMGNPNEISPESQAGMLDMVDNAFATLDQLDDPEKLTASLSGVLNMAGLVSEVSSNVANVNDADNPDTDGVKKMSSDSAEVLMQKVIFIFAKLLDGCAVLRKK